MAEGTAKQSAFIDGYNELHKALQDLAAPYFEEIAHNKRQDDFIDARKAKRFLENNFIPFMNAVHMLKDDHEFLKRNVNNLTKINELRNVIVHEYNSDEGLYEIIEIAEPTDFAMTLLDDVKTKLLNPLTLDQYLKEKDKYEVQFLRTDDKVTHLFQLISENAYSQFPVFDGEGQFQGLISDNGIAIWISHFVVGNMTSGKLDVRDATVSEILKVDEKSESFTVVTKDTLLFNTLHYFDVAGESEVRPIMLVTSNDSADVANLHPDNLIGILTSHDYLDMYTSAITQFNN
jgi:predicted transcriptional regulator